MQKLAFLLGLGFTLVAQAHYASSRALVIRHITVIDATGTPPKPNMTVWIKDGRITEITKTATGRKGAVEIDGTGKFLIPGLWDMHVHIAGVSADPKWSKFTLLPVFLANGIVGVRDMGGNLDALIQWKKELAAGTLTGPHLVVAGPMLELAKEASPEVVAVHNPAEGRKAVDDLSSRGVDFIKVLSRVSRESFLAIAAEARAKNLPVAGHVPMTMSAAEVSAAGMRSIEHIFYSNLAFDCSSRETELRGKLSAAMAAREEAASEAIYEEAVATFSKKKADALWKTLRDNKTWVVPTLAAMEAASSLDKVSPSDPGLAYIPKSLANEWRPEKLAKQHPPAEMQFFRRQFENDRKIAREMHRAGVRMLAGSDSLDTHYFPGASLHRELALLVEAGFTQMEALQAATRAPAEFLGQQKEWGTVEKGKIANLALLDANPLDNIANTSRIAGMIVDGKYFSAEELEKMMARARADAQKY